MQQRARRLSVFGGPETVAGAIPKSVPREPPPIVECFAWQTDYWLIGDILAIIRNANVDSGGQRTTVPDSVVKRIEKIAVISSPLAIGRAGAEAGHAATEEGSSAPAAPAGGAGAAMVAPDFNKSISGRWSGVGNDVYDVLLTRVNLIVSSKRLPQLFDAICRTNFMTVTDCDLSEVDLWSELDQGYFYGDESVVRASIEIEVVWLRSWTRAFMPKEVRTHLNIPDPPPAESASEADKSKKTDT